MKKSILWSAVLSLLLGSIHTTVFAVTLLHDYQLNGSLADNLGGPAFVSLGGGVGATRYTFAPNQGLRLTGGLLSTSNYSIDFSAQYSSTSPFWKKMIDFQNLASDQGLYMGGDRLFFIAQRQVGQHLLRQEPTSTWPSPGTVQPA